MIQAEKAEGRRFVLDLVNMHAVQTLRLHDKARNRGLDLPPLLPTGWSFRVVSLHDSVLENMRQAGYDTDSLNAKRGWAKQIPAVPYPESKLVCVPIYRLFQIAQGIDEIAEQIVYNIGLGKASPKRTGQLQTVHTYARKFLTDTLGRPLMMLGDR